jgi:hypothetical protein
VSRPAPLATAVLFPFVSVVDVTSDDGGDARCLAPTLVVTANDQPLVDRLLGSPLDDD